MTVNQRVFITGLGALTASGATADENWEAIVSGKTNLAPIDDWLLEDGSACLGGELKNFQGAKLLPDRKLIKLISRQDVMGIHVAMQAVNHSGMLSYRDSLEQTAHFNDHTAIYVGSPGNKYFQQYDFLPLLSKTKSDMTAFAEQLFSEVHPTWLLRILPNNVLAYAGIHCGFKGPNHNFTNHAVSGTQALLEAHRAIQSGAVERAVVVAYDMGLEKQALFYYDKLGVLSGRDLQPFAHEHDGTVLAEGAAALVLESEASAQKRQANCLAEILGGGSATEATGLFSIEEEGQELTRLLNQTLESCQISASEISMVIAHGNGNPKSDNSEAKAIQQVFGAGLPVTAFKWSMGHSLCASGILDTLLGVYALKHQCVPGIANFTKPCESAQGLALSASHQTLNNPSHALLINRGFASMNACLVLKSCD